MLLLRNDIWLGDRLVRGNNSYPSRDLERVDKIVIHHTATSAGVSIAQIASYHVYSQGWPGIGYHVVVGEDGIPWMTQTPWTVSYHVRGGGVQQGISLNNWRSIGIALVGNFSQGYQPTPEQIETTRQLITELNQLFALIRDGRTIEYIYGHRELSADTECPGSNYLDWLPQLREELGYGPL